MTKEEKLNKIVEYIKENKIGKYKELARLIKVSESTVRNYLAELEEREEITIVRGGAVSRRDDITKQIMDIRADVNREEKEELVKLLGKYIIDGHAVAINGGTTAIVAAKYLKDNYDRLTIITNNLNIVSILRSKPDFRCIVCGGIINNKENTTIAGNYEEIIQNYNVDYALIGVNSISLEKGITDFREEERKVIKAMTQIAEKTIIMADHNKFDNVACFNILPLNDDEIILTDSGIDEDTYIKYIKKGLNIVKG